MDNYVSFKRKNGLERMLLPFASNTMRQGHLTFISTANFNSYCWKQARGAWESQWSNVCFYKSEPGNKKNSRDAGQALHQPGQRIVHKRVSGQMTAVQSQTVVNQARKIYAFMNRKTNRVLCSNMS